MDLFLIIKAFITANKAVKALNRAIMNAVKPRVLQPNTYAGIKSFIKISPVKLMIKRRLEDFFYAENLFHKKNRKILERCGITFYLIKFFILTCKFFWKKIYQFIS